MHSHADSILRSVKINTFISSYISNAASLKFDVSDLHFKFKEIQKKSTNSLLVCDGTNPAVI